MSNSVQQVPGIQGTQILLNSLNTIFLEANQISAYNTTLSLGTLNVSNIRQSGQSIIVRGYTDRNLTESDIINGLIVFTSDPTTNSDYPYQYNVPYDLNQNPYTVDSTIFYEGGNSVPSLPNTLNHIQVEGSVLPLVLPTLFTQLSVGQSAEITIVNNGNSSLRLAETSNEKTVGFDIVYDATSAKFIVKRQTNTLTYFIRSA
jgi:hypothetical protein